MRKSVVTAFRKFTGNLRQQLRSGVFIVNFEYISHFF